MQTLLRVVVRKRLEFAGWIAASSLFAISSAAQQPAARITTVVDDAERTTIHGTHPVVARTEDDAGRVPLASKLRGLSIAFSRTPAQEADLHALLTAQQDPSSPLYHQWLTPDDFGARFGLGDSDIAKVQSWLEKHGFTVESVSRSKNRISFSGTVEQVEAAFGTEMHYYKVNGETHFAPSRDVSVPAALSSVVETVTNLSTFRPKSHISSRGPRRAISPDFTSNQSGNHFLTPNDVATIYDINPAHKAGYNGAGQSIAVVGQSAIVLSDIEHFQTAAGFAVKDPTLVLVPNTGTATVRSGDESESDLDLEYTSTIANGATIYFVYVGSNANNNVFDSIQFAVTNRTAPIISVSYGLCETALGSSGYSSLNPVLAQAASQGQSVIVASGDSGSTDCYGEAGLTTAQQQAIAVDFPASSQYVTAMGGTEFPAADVASTNTTYWQAASGSDLVSSALSYIPEQVWNDDSTAGLSSGGGGVSTLTSRPSWQTGVPGIPSGTFRFVPDISLTSSPNNAGYLFCSSDTSIGVTGSCTNGFRDSNNVNLTVAGGTSFAAPIFAGMLAVINDKLNSTGQGVINSTLYTLAANSATYASAFHDITSGGNQCTAGTSICSTAGASEYPATPGYDEASGLGSVDLFNLMTAWPGSSSSLVPSKTSLSAATMTPAAGASDAITVTVASASTSSTATPTGTLTVNVDGTLQTSSLALVSGSATYNFSSTTSGAHVIAATYSGDSTYASSTGSLTVTVPSPPLAMAQSVTTTANTPKAITLTATPGTPGDTLTYVIVTNPAHGTLSGTVPNVTYTPATGYLGPDSFSFDVTENGVASNTATVSITVAAAPPPPVANNQSLSTNKNSAIAITLTGTPGTSGDTLAFAIATNPTQGTVSGTPPNITYTPTTGYVGPDSFTFNVTESNGATSTTPGTVSINVVQAPPVASKTTLSAATSTPAPGASDAISITVASASASSTTTPTGTLTIAVDGTTQTPSLTLTNGSASYTFSATAAGAHSIAAAYSGDSNYSASSGSLTVTVTAPPPVASKTTLSAATSTPAPGASDAISITVTSASASSTTTPTGTLTIAVDGTAQTPSLTLTNGSATYTFSATAAGAHSIAAAYSGDSNYAASSGSLTVTVTAPPPVASKTTLSAATSTPAPGASDAISITVTSASASSTTTPTGTLTIAVDGTAQTPSLTLTNGSATYTFSATAAGAHSIAAAYSGDSNYSASSGSLALTVLAKSFKLAASNVTVTAGNPGVSTVTITPQNGYTGTVAWTVASSPALTNGCLSIANTTVSGTTAVAATLAVNTVASACPTPALVGARVDPRNIFDGEPHSYRKDPTPFVALQTNQASIVMVGLLFIGFAGRRCRRLASLATLCILAAIGLAASGCAGVSSSTPPPSSPVAAKGTYAITIVGTDTATSSITASTSLTLTVD
jgi:subtilase family serine protease